VATTANIPLLLPSSPLLHFSISSPELGIIRHRAVSGW
jgi:hypothetical protein